MLLVRRKEATAGSNSSFAFQPQPISMSLLRTSISRSLSRQVSISSSASASQFQVRHNSSTRDGPDAKHLTPSRVQGQRDLAQDQKDRENTPLQASLTSDAPRAYQYEGFV